MENTTKATVQTVKGALPVEDLGVTLMHEHVFVLTPELLSVGFPERWEESTRLTDAIEKLNRLTEIGVTTIVDPTVIGLGRDIRRIIKVQQETTLQIVVATGLYTYRDLPFPVFFNRGGKGGI